MLRRLAQLIPPPHLGALTATGDVDGCAAALTRVLAAGDRRADVRAYAERYGWDEPVAALVETFCEAAAGVPR